MAVLFLTVRVKLVILSIEKALSAMVSFPRLSQTIRMTALLGRLGRSFLIVMDLLKDRP